MPAVRSALVAWLLVGPVPFASWGAGAATDAPVERTYLIGSLRISGAAASLPAAGPATATLDIDNRGPGADRLLSATLGPSGKATIAGVDAGTALQADPAGGLVIPSGHAVSLTLTVAPAAVAPATATVPDQPAPPDPLGGVLVFERAGTLPIDYTLAGNPAPTPAAPDQK